MAQTPEEIEEAKIEELAIQQNRKGWSHLFMRAENGSPYGKFCSTRPIPKFFWQQVDDWIAGYKYAKQNP